MNGMNVNNVHRDRFRLLPIVILSLFFVSCESIKDDMDDCGIYLEFVYDYNMEYVDSFELQVETVNVFVFDGKGLYLFNRHVGRKELVGGKRMFFGNDFRPGEYKILTIGGLTEHFKVVDKDGNFLSPGQTMLEDVRITLNRTSGTVSHGFSPLWVGQTIDIQNKSDLSVFPVHLVKNTNRFTLLLDKSEKYAGARSGAAAYTFEIETPEGAVYGHDNMPRLRENVRYIPYELTTGSEPGVLSAGRLNTVRLVYGEDYNYKLTVRDARSGSVLWDYDLMSLLEEIKPAKGLDGNDLSMQEFLDRQSEWHLVLLYKEGSGPDGFVAVGIKINNWIIWFNDIGV
ncbi:FimB/Mfa2 family fimbrial subunit [Butyricimonas hominis]|uniref:FimB/Mfa2 family fimbrial subunit n=1 Tax=Butyricimonas hominis TaxID=2763032 RepID=A0ABR7D578_9BACT|nr:FimB/Mfa2 family fimbrial subunit [Butyricimonas hominis]MBC5622500.1 FimB/Mfa2 family fimbrial subunit [Butyricimonas hominis]